MSEDKIANKSLNYVCTLVSSLSAGWFIADGIWYLAGANIGIVILCIIAVCRKKAV